MPPPYGTRYDPAAGFRAAANPYAARRPRQPWGLDWPSWRDTMTPPQADYLEQLPYRPRGAWGGAADVVRATQYGGYGAPPAQPTIYADSGQAALYGSTARPEGYGDVAPVQAQGASGLTPTAPTTEEDYWLNRWAIEQAEREATRAEQQYQYDTSRQDQRQAALVNAFGVFGQQAAPSATGQAGEAMSARGAITNDRIKAQEQRAALQQAIGAQEAAAQAGPQVYTPELNPMPIAGLPQPYQGRHTLGPHEAEMMGAWNPRPQWISGAASSMSVDEGARNTMRGNQAFGIHVDRGSSVRQAGGPDTNRFNRLVDDTSPEGEANWQEYEKFVLGDPNERLNPNDPNSPLKYPGSPRASILERGEDAGNMTPAERAYLQGLRRRRGRAR